MGPTYTQYKVVNFSDRRQYREATEVAYLDLANDNLVFTQTPSSGLAVEYDYHYLPANVGSGESSWIPAQFDDIIYHGMCADDFMIQQSEKARSYRDENIAAYNMWLEKLAYWNANLIQM